MNLLELAKWFGGRKKLASTICIDRHTISRWHEQGIPLTGALAVSSALDTRAKEMQEASRRIRKAVTDARLRQEKHILGF